MNNQGGNTWRCACGQENPRQANYCGSCGGVRPMQQGECGQQGNDIQQAPQGQSGSPVPPPAYAVPMEKPRRKKTWLIVVLALVVLGAAAAGLLLWAPWDIGTTTPTVLPVSAGDKSAEAEQIAETAEQPAAEPGPAAEEEKAEAPAQTSEWAGTYTITVWASDMSVGLFQEQIAEFNRSNEYGITINATVVPVSEADAANQTLQYPQDGADLYCFAQDQLALLVQNEALTGLGAAPAEKLRRENSAGAVAAASFNGTLYAYPLSASNGYFMYYDKSVIPEEDVDSLEALIADCERTNRFFAFEVESSAWYMASWFFATGCVSEWATDSTGNFISVKDTFNSPEGLIAAKGMKKLLDSPAFLDSSLAEELASRAAVVVSGTWDYLTAKSVLGGDLGVADLPSFTVDGKEYHLSSFNACKLLGVKPQTDEKKGAALHLLAQYLCGEQCQMERFEQLGWVPSNRNVQASPSVQADPALAALLQQNEYSVPQGMIHGSWWDIGRSLTAEIGAASDEADLKAALKAYQGRIDLLFQNSTELKSWGVIGSICGTSWDTDFPMTEIAPGVFRSEPLQLYAGDEFKVRYSGTWDLNYGIDGKYGENFRVEQSGTYYVVFDKNQELLYLERP